MRKILPFLLRATQLGLLSKDLARLKFTRSRAPQLQAEQRIIDRLAQLHGLPQKIGQILSVSPLRPSDRRFSCLTEGPPALSERAALAEIARQLAQCPAEGRGAARASQRRFQWRPSPARVLADHFQSIQPRGIGASLGQVHRASLRTGEAVAVKIQYPKAADQLQADLMSLGWLTGAMGGKTRGFDLGAYRREIGQMLRAELDYRREADWLRRFGEWTRSWKHFEVPRVIEPLSGPRMLTMSWVTGESSEVVQGWTADQRRTAGECLLKFFLWGCLEWRALHADPHSGNYRFRLQENEVRIGVLDFGCVKPVSLELSRGLGHWIGEVMSGAISDGSAWDHHLQLGYDPKMLEALRPKLAAVSRILLEPFCAPGLYHTRNWKLGERLAETLGEHRMKYRLAAPPEMIYLVRAFQGLQAYLRALDVPLDWRGQLPVHEPGRGETPSSPDSPAGHDSRARPSLASPVDGLMVPRRDQGIVQAPPVHGMTPQPSVAIPAPASEEAPISEAPTSTTTLMKAETLRIRVTDLGACKADLTFGAEAVDQLASLVPLELRERLRERQIDLAATVVRIQRSGYAPGPVFDWEDGSKQVRIWLE